MENIKQMLISIILGEIDILLQKDIGKVIAKHCTSTETQILDLCYTEEINYLLDLAKTINLYRK